MKRKRYCVDITIAVSLSVNRFVYVPYFYTYSLLQRGGLSPCFVPSHLHGLQSDAVFV